MGLWLRIFINYLLLHFHQLSLAACLVECFFVRITLQKDSMTGVGQDFNKAFCMKYLLATFLNMVHNPHVENHCSNCFAWVVSSAYLHYIISVTIEHSACGTATFQITVVLLKFSNSWKKMQKRGKMFPDHRQKSAWNLNDRLSCAQNLFFYNTGFPELLEYPERSVPACFPLWSGLVTTRPVQSEPKQLCGWSRRPKLWNGAAEAGAWNLGPRSTALLCGPSGLCKWCSGIQFSMDQIILDLELKAFKCFKYWSWSPKIQIPGVNAWNLSSGSTALVTNTTGVSWRGFWRMHSQSFRTS